MKHHFIYGFFSLLLASSLVAGGFFLLQANPPAQAAGPTTAPGSVTGWAFSDMPNGSDENLTPTNHFGGRGLGWISMSGTTAGGDNYGVQEDSTGLLSGYAWGGFIGWISFNQSDLSGCPSGTCEAQVNQATGQVSGWARAISLESNVNSDGQDGWIDLGDGGLHVYPNCQWQGYAWAGPVVGWISFNDVSGCAASANTALVTISVTPSSITNGGTATLNWAIQNATCTASDNGSGSFSGTKTTDGSQGVSPAVTTTYTLNCTSTVDNSPLSAKTTLTVAAAPPSVSLTVSKSSIAPGGSTVVSWTSSGATSCSTNFGASGLNNTGITESPSNTTTYSVTCINSSGTPAQDSKTVTVTGGAPPSGAPDIISFYSNAVCQLSWDVESFSSCTIMENGNPTSVKTFSSGQPTGSFSAGSSDTATTYTLNCTNGTSPAVSAITTCSPYNEIEQ